MKTKFFLRENKSKLTINFEFRNASIRFRGATPYTVNNLKEWDEKKERIKLPSTRINAYKDNINLNEISTKFLESLGNYKINEITVKQISEIYKQVVDSVCGKKVIVTTEIPSEEEPLMIVLNYFDFYIKKYQAQPTPSTKKVIKKESMASYKSAKMHIESYLNKNKISKFTFDDIDEKFYDNFVDYLHEKDLTLNYIGTIIRKLKTIMKSAFSRDITNNINFQKPYFIAQSEVVNHPYLTEEEIQKITNLAIEDEKDRNIRDIFVMQCYTGFRIEDLLNQLKNTNIIEQNDRKFLFTKQRKTGGDVYVPINAKVKKIISDNKGKLPEYVHQNEINERIKSICKRAKINDNYSMERTYGISKRIETKPKYKFICTHTARRSFCTNAYMAGVPVHHIMAISGHKTEKIFLNYVKVEKKFEAIKIAENVFFQ
jgi:integrase